MCPTCHRAKALNGHTGRLVRAKPHPCPIARARPVRGRSGREQRGPQPAATAAVGGGSSAGAGAARPRPEATPGARDAACSLRVKKDAARRRQIHGGQGLAAWGVGEPNGSGDPAMADSDAREHLRRRIKTRNKGEMEGISQRSCRASQWARGCVGDDESMTKLCGGRRGRR